MGRSVQRSSCRVSLPRLLSSCLFASLFCTVQTLWAAQDGEWQQKVSLGEWRHGAVGFSIGDKGYIGTGTTARAYYGTKDFWEYSPATNTWTQKADFGGSGREGAVGFSIGNKGYIGSGDFWEYDPAANTWTRKADFGGVGRRYAIAFAIGGKGYVGLGDPNYTYKDFWEYEPSANAWTRKADFGGTGREGAVGFAIGNKGYAGTGYDQHSACADFWEYDPLSDTWTRKADFGGGGRIWAAGFSIGPKGYLGTGSSNSAQKTDLWEYDPVVDGWTRKADFGGEGRIQAAAFSLGHKGYLGTGSSFNNTNYSQKDFWEFTPSALYTAPLPEHAFLQRVSFAVPYTSGALAFNPGNVFTAFLSDASGNFVSEMAIGAIDSTDPAGAILVTIPAEVPDGTGYRLRVKASDPAWTGSDNGRDITISPGSLAINSGAAHATGLAVNLSIACRAAGGCAAMSFSTDAIEWSPPEAYTASKPWALAPGDGMKTVAVKLQDTDGNWFGPYASSIILDTVAPTMTATGAPPSPTTSTSATITVAGDGVVAYRYKLDGGSYSGDRDISVPHIPLTSLSEGTHTIWVVGRDAAGNWQPEESAARLAWIVDTDYGKGLWNLKADFGGGQRYGAVALAIGGKAYVGTGWNGSATTRDFWEYDPASNAWTQKASFGNAPRVYAVGFVIGDKGYVGTGRDGMFSGYVWKDFWEYDAQENVWNRKADFGGSARYGAVGFSIGDKGYIGTGADSISVNSDLWEYDPANDLWTRRTDLPGGARHSAAGFSLGGKGYLGTGYAIVSASGAITLASRVPMGLGGTGYSLQQTKDFWEYDPLRNKWTRKADFAGTRYGAVAYTIGDKGYMGMGSQYKKDVWEYDPADDTWTQGTDYSGYARCYAVGLAVGGKAHIGLGEYSPMDREFRDFTPAGVYLGPLPEVPLRQGGGIAVPFSAVTLSFNPGNVFTAYLSDPSGDFTNERAIGAVSSTETPGTIQATMPVTIIYGEGYRIRVKSSDPVWVSAALRLSQEVSLADAILALKIVAGLTPSGQRAAAAYDANNDSKIGLEEVIFILQKAAESRP